MEPLLNCSLTVTAGTCRMPGHAIIVIDYTLLHRLIHLYLCPRNCGAYVCNNAIIFGGNMSIHLKSRTNTSHRQLSPMP